MKPLNYLLTIAIFVSTALAAFGQGASVGTGGNSASTYSVNLLPLPTATLAGGTPGTVGTITNFYFGYTNVTYSTNIASGLYTNNLNGTGSAGFYTSTNIVTNTAVVYPSIFFPRQSRLALEYRGISSSQNTNCIFTFAKSVSGLNGQADTSQQFNWSFPINQGANNTIAVTNFPADFLGGEGYLYLIAQEWQSTNSSTLTNIDGGIKYAIKPAAP